MTFLTTIIFPIAIFLLVLWCIAFSEDRETREGSHWPFFALVALGFYFYPGIKLIDISIINVILISVIYLFIGLGWSLFKWYKYVKFKYKYYKDQVDYKTSRGQTIGEGLINYNRPVASQNKSSIIAWMLYWPFSVLRYVLGSLVGDLLEAIFSAVEKRFDSITAKVYGE